MMKKILISVAAILIIGTTVLYYDSYENYQDFILLSYREQTQYVNEHPIKYKLMKSLLFWIAIPERPTP